jgi:hypothetical protein
MKLIESEVGTVAMADGTRRNAYRNTYRVTVFSADGTSASMVEESRIEFSLFVNVNYSGRKFRKATSKQAVTFEAASKA